MKPSDDKMHEQQNPMVTIIVDDDPLPIHRGRRSVAEIKKAAGVPLAYDLDQIVDGKFEPLADDGSLTIKGDEKFISHPKDGSSS